MIITKWREREMENTSSLTKITSPALITSVYVSQKHLLKVDNATKSQNSKIFWDTWLKSERCVVDVVVNMFCSRSHL